MIRLFDTHYVREVQELDGMWSVTMETADGQKLPGEYSMPVPGCLEQHPQFLNFRGHAVYRRKVMVKNDGNVRLEFKGVSHTGDVYWDGEKVAHHYNAFTPFSVVLPKVKAGIHEICVRVDNTFWEHSALHVPNDYYTYGGITRPIAMEVVPEVYLKQVHFTPEYVEGHWQAEVEILLENCSDSSVTCELEQYLSMENDVVSGIGIPAANCVQKSEKIQIEAGSEYRLCYTTAPLPEITPWSQKTPRLYYLTTLLKTDGQVTDDLIDRVGFRTVTVEGKHILLNGRPLYVKGFNRHEDYATVGCAIPLQLMVQDMDLMEAAGANAVRTCHYPNDERFLDLCDERGMLVWEENHARGFGLERMQNPHFEQQCKDCIQEMISNHYNHPSVFIWGILNECASETEEGREMYRRQYEQIRSLDRSRPTTSATCRHFTDICLDLPDVVSFNMYSGWYQDVDPGKRNEEELAWIRKAGGENKPVIVSEVGAAALYGYRDRSHCKWSEERQCDILRENLETYMTHPDISGLFVWQFADCRVTEEEWFPTRARCHNNKGVVDEYRRPKEAYDTVTEMFRKYWTEEEK